MAGRPPLPIPGQTPPSLPARRPPPVPRPPSDEEIYDDFEEEPPLPEVADFSQDVYEATDDVAPPPPPSSRPPPAIPSSSLPPPPPPARIEPEPQEEVYADPDEHPEVYEAVDEDKPGIPAPPPIPPNRTKREPLPPPDVPASRPEPKPPAAPRGGLVIDASSLANTLGNLRKTSAKPEAKGPGDKVYTDNSTFHDKKNLFEHRSSSVEDPPVKSPTTPKTPSIVPLSKPPLPGRPNASGAKPPPKPPHSQHSSSSDSGGSLKSPAVPESPGSDDGEELYDDGSSFQILDPLIGNSWYFPQVERKEAEKKLNKHIGEDGTFLVRKSSRDPKKPYTIDVIYQKRIYHLQVRQRPDKHFALGSEKDDEMHFKDVKELVDHHKKKEVILIGDHPGSVLLKKSP